MELFLTVEEVKALEATDLNDLEVDLYYQVFLEKQAA